MGRFVLRTEPQVTGRYSKSAVAGFTIIELTMVIILVAVLAVVAMAKLSRVDSFQVYGFSDATRAAVRFAQKVAVAQRTNVVVVLNPASVNLCYTSAACTFPVIDPATGRAMTVTAPTGITLSGPATINFDGLGRASPGGTITVRGAGVVLGLVVERETGYVHD